MDTFVLFKAAQRLLINAQFAAPLFKILFFVRKIALLVFTQLFVQLDLKNQFLIQILTIYKSTSMTTINRQHTLILIRLKTPIRGARKILDLARLWLLLCKLAASTLKDNVRRALQTATFLKSTEK
jgi:hypothetical protein